MDFSMKKSFNNRNSINKHIRKISAGGSLSSNSSNHEAQPILSYHQLDAQQEPLPMATVDLADHNELIVKVDPAGGDSSSVYTSFSSSKVQREPSFDFMQHGQHSREDSTPRMQLGQLLNEKKTLSDQFSLEMDLEMDELRRESLEGIHRLSESPQTKRSSRETFVSFEPYVPSVLDDSAANSVRRRYKDSLERNDHEQQRGDDEVLKSTSISLQRQASLLSRLRKSRLADLSSEEMQRMSGLIQKSGQLRSGMLGRAINDDDDDDNDSFEDEDLPEKYKRADNNLSTSTMVQWVSLVAIIGALVCSLSVPALRKECFLRLNLWRWLVLLLVLICGRLVSGWGIRIIVFLIERNCLLRKRVLYFVYGLRNGVQNSIWFGLVLLSWHYLFDKKVQRETHSHLLNFITKILVCFLVANCIWLVKTIIIKVLASSFHVGTYFDRIQDSLFNQFVIETLSGPPLIEMRRAEEEAANIAAEVCKLQNAGATMPPDLKAAVFPPAKFGQMTASGEMEKSSGGKSFRFSPRHSKKVENKGSDDFITIEHLNRLNNRNVSAWNMKRLMSIVRHGSLTTLDEQIGATTEAETTTEIRNECEAKAAARKIFYNVARSESRYIYLEDLLRFMREVEALRTMTIFEGAAETGRISKSSLKKWVVNAFRDRRSLALTLNDTKTAVNRLHRIINIIVAIIIVIIWILILGIAKTKFFLFLGSQIVLSSFVFGNTVKTLFESIIFLFIIHPFDVGDRCEVEGMQLVVEEMNILTTVFIRGTDNEKIVYYNAVLATKYIGNYYRSPDMYETVTFYIHISTPEEKLAAIKQKITNYIESSNKHWHPNPIILFVEHEEFKSMKVEVWLIHRINYQDMAERWLRRSQMYEDTLKIFRGLGIGYNGSPLDVNVLKMPPGKWELLPSSSM